jgi:hypothetical protein
LPLSLTERVRTAHGDAWQAEGRLRAPFGGGADVIRGARLMASGLPTPKWNNADITARDFDREGLLDWYELRNVPWGIRVPLEIDVDLGQPLFEKLAAGLVPEAFRAASAPAGVAIRLATPADLDAYGAVEMARFGGDEELERRWLAPALGAPGFSHWIAESGGEAVGVAMTLSTDDLAGPAAYMAGVAAIPGWADRDLEPMLASVAAEAAFKAGATLVHTNPDDDELEWVASLGFVEVPGFLVRVVRAN